MFDVTHLLTTGGLLLLGLIIFAESGMMIGFIFPGDTLLISAGILAAANKLDIVTVLLTIGIAAIIGDNVGYQIGKSLGPRLFNRKDGVVFRKEYIERAHAFFARYGNRTMLLAHFIPVVRSFAPVVAGAGDMPRKQFIVYDAVGDIAWTLLITFLGFFLGRRVPGIEKLIEPILLGIIVLFLAPTLWHIFRDPRMRSTISSRFRRK